MKNWRIFWTCKLEESGHSWWYYHWTNWLTGDKATIFAGYNKKALRKKNSTFKDIIT